MPKPLTATERAYFDTIKQVAQSARPADLALLRMTLDGADVAIVAQRVLDTNTGEEVGWQPLALLLASDGDMKHLRMPDGSEPITYSPDDVEGAG